MVSASSKKKDFFTDILLSVSVPVLSVQIISVEPSVSTAGSVFTIARCSLIFLTPIESVIVTQVGSPSGMAHTATAIAIVNDEKMFPPVEMPTIKITKAIASMMPVSHKLVVLMRFVSGVVSSFISPSAEAILPISVCIPVAVTTPFPLP